MTILIHDPEKLRASDIMLKIMTAGEEVFPVEVRIGGERFTVSHSQAGAFASGMLCCLSAKEAEGKA